MVPAEARGKLEPAEVFHEILQHRWFLSEQRGAEVDTFEAAADYIANVLSQPRASRPEAELRPGDRGRRTPHDGLRRAAAT